MPVRVRCGVRVSYAVAFAFAFACSPRPAPPASHRLPIHTLAFTPHSVIILSRPFLAPSRAPSRLLASPACSCMSMSTSISPPSAHDDTSESTDPHAAAPAGGVRAPGSRNRGRPPPCSRGVPWPRAPRDARHGAPWGRQGRARRGAGLRGIGTIAIRSDPAMFARSVGPTCRARRVRGVLPHGAGMPLLPGRPRFFFF